MKLRSGDSGTGVLQSGGRVQQLSSKLLYSLQAQASRARWESTTNLLLVNVASCLTSSIRSQCASCLWTALNTVSPSTDTVAAFPAAMTALLQTDCPTLKLLARGKVRDIYEVEEDKSGLLFVATDRVSAFDVIMKTVRSSRRPCSLPLTWLAPQGVPNKGKLLTQLSLFFFEYLSKAPETKHIPNHVITSKIEEMPAEVQKYRDQLEGRSIWVRRATVLPVEAIVRGYITGKFPVFRRSAWYGRL